MKTSSPLASALAALVLFLALALLGCGGDELPVGACCMTCHPATSYACGDACIPLTEPCEAHAALPPGAIPPGCACDARIPGLPTSL